MEEARAVVTGAKKVPIPIKAVVRVKLTTGLGIFWRRGLAEELGARIADWLGKSLLLVLVNSKLDPIRIYAQDIKLSNNTADARRLEEQKKEIMEEHRKELENLRRKIETKMESMEKSYGEKMGKIETQLSHITSLLEKVSQPQASGTSESHGDDPDKPSEGQKL